MQSPVYHFIFSKKKITDFHPLYQMVNGMGN